MRMQVTKVNKLISMKILPWPNISEFLLCAAKRNNNIYDVENDPAKFGMTPKRVSMNAFFCERFSLNKYVNPMSPNPTQAKV
jgi:hypothetical protein